MATYQLNILEGMEIYCVKCGKEMEARLTNGEEIYPHRKDLHDLPFWKCDTCGNYVGCHHKSDSPTKPLGVIPTAELKVARQKLHALIDPLWKSGQMTRKEVYSHLSRELGYRYHTGEVKSVEEAQNIEFVARKLLTH